MFTGIIEATGLITNISQSGTNLIFSIESRLAPGLKVDQSLSHDGVCLTVESIANNCHIVTAVQETLSKTTLGGWKIGQHINLEQCLQWNGRLDGHIVQGHADTTATCVLKKELAGSWLYRFQFPQHFASLVIEKGSICINGISLTLFEVSSNEFSVTIIPYTYEHTNIKQLMPGGSVNLEFDIIGKYITRHLQLTRVNSF